MTTRLPNPRSPIEDVTLGEQTAQLAEARQLRLPQAALGQREHRAAAEHPQHHQKHQRTTRRRRLHGRIHGANFPHVAQRHRGAIDELERAALERTAARSAALAGGLCGGGLVGAVNTLSRLHHGSVAKKSCRTASGSVR